MTGQIIELPGSWIESEDRDWAFRVQMLLRSAADELDEAALILELFEAPWAEGMARVGQSGANDSRPFGAGRVVFVYARAFVYAFDAMVQLVRVIGRMPRVSDAAKRCCEQVDAEYGYCRKIRNSLQHLEDRLQGLGPGQKSIPTSILVVGGAFTDRRFGATVDTGEYMDIEISMAPIRRAAELLTELAWSFEWIAPGDQRVVRPSLGA